MPAWKLDGQNKIDDFELTINLLGAPANIANIKTDIVVEGGGRRREKESLRVIVSKGTALSDAFWEEHGETITDYLVSHLGRITNE